MSDKISRTVGVVVLAAGEGTRLKLGLPKPLAPLSGEKLIDYSIHTSASFLAKPGVEGKVGVVIGYEKERVKEHLLDCFGNVVDFAVQKEQLGTADALKAYFCDCDWASKMDMTLVMCADTPLLKDKDLADLWDEMIKENLDGVAATFTEEEPTGYGRIIRGAKNGFRIVEQKEANVEQRKITEVNSGLYLLKTSFVLQALNSISSNNKAGEFYLTDLFKEGANVKPVLFENKNKFLGVNTLKQLEMVQRELFESKIQFLREKGVRFIDSKSCYIENSVSVGSGTVIYPNCYLQGKTKVGENCVLEPGVILINSLLYEQVIVKAYSHLEGSEIRDGAAIGPFARLRSGTVLGEASKVGNFVETKKAKIGSKSAVSHLSYLGDAEVGENSNIGCGFITCNYDGDEKHKTKIGNNAFIGSDTQVIAPISIGDSAYIASGSTVNRDVPDCSFAIARSTQETKEGMAYRFLKGKWAIKKKKDKKDH